MPRGKYDVIIFGATSFVGGILTRYIAAQYGWNKDLKWAIAGRSERKLQQVRGTKNNDVILTAWHVSLLKLSKKRV